MPEFVADALDRHILSIEEERPLDGKYHPSSMFMCARATILAVRGVPVATEADAQAKRIFRIGHLYHALVQQALPGSPRVVAAYEEFGVGIPQWNIVGAGDMLVLLDNGEWWVIEIKSTKSLRYTPKPDHLKQASVYFTGARDFGVRVDDGPEESYNILNPLGDKLKGIILVYLNKNDLEVKEYTFPYDPQWRIDIEKRVAELDKYRLVRVEELPKKLPLDKGKPNWFTNYCGYRGSGLCCGDNEGDYEW